MRSLIALALALAGGCAHAPKPLVPKPEIEVVLDEGRASEKPLTPPRAFEMLMRFDPKLPAYRPVRMRFLLAQPGHVQFNFYAINDEGRPGATLLTIDRIYGAELAGGAGDGKWLVEALDGIPPQKGAIFVGISCPEKHSDPRLWASSNDTGLVYERDADPTVPLDRLRIPRTPKLRLDVESDSP